MFYVNGYNLSGYSPDPDSLHVFATLDDAREDHKDTLNRWAEGCFEVPTDRPDEQADLEAISASLAGSAEIVHEWIDERGGYSVERGPDGNDYTFWTEPKTFVELLADGWTKDDLDHLDVCEACGEQRADDPDFCNACLRDMAAKRKP